MYEASFAGLAGALEISEFLLMCAFLGHSGFVGAVLVILLIDVKRREIEGGPKSEGQSEDEELIQPTVLEGLADQSPSSLHKWLRVPSRHDLGLTT